MALSVLLSRQLLPQWGLLWQKDEHLNTSKLRREAWGETSKSTDCKGLTGGLLMETPWLFLFMIVKWLMGAC